MGSNLSTYFPSTQKYSLESLFAEYSPQEHNKQSNVNNKEQETELEYNEVRVGEGLVLRIEPISPTSFHPSDPSALLFFRVRTFLFKNYYNNYNSCSIE